MQLTPSGDPVTIQLECPVAVGFDQLASVASATISLD